MLSFTTCDGASAASSREDRIAASGAASAICRWIHFIATWHKSGAVLHGGRFAAGDACAKNSSSDACRCTDAKLVKKKGKSKISVLDSLRCSEQVDEWSPYADSLLQLVGPISEVKKSY